MAQSTKAYPNPLKPNTANLFPGLFPSCSRVISELLTFALGQIGIYAHGEECVYKIRTGLGVSRRFNGNHADAAGRHKLHWDGPKITHPCILVTQSSFFEIVSLGVLERDTILCVGVLQLS